MEDLENMQKPLVRLVSNDRALLLIYETLMDDVIGMRWMEPYGCHGRPMNG